MLKFSGLIVAAVVTMVLVTSVPLSADDAAEKAELAKKTLNPVADLISIPFQFNYDHHIGPEDDGEKMVLNIQPVIPISISRDWNLISRTILPVIDQNDILPGGAADETGIGDVTLLFPK